MKLKGQIPVALYTIKNGVNKPIHEIEAEIIRTVRKEIGAVASLKKAIQVKRLPKTRSGKILRRLVRAILDGDTYSIPSTLDNPKIPSELEETLQAINYSSTKKSVNA